MGRKRAFQNFVRHVLEAIAEQMPPEWAALLLAQLDAATRLYVAEGSVYLYRIRYWGFGKVDWSGVATFPNCNLTHLLANVSFKLDGDERLYRSKVYLVKGHVFEITYSFPQNILRKASVLSNVSVALSADYLSPSTQSEDIPAALLEIPQCIKTILDPSPGMDTQCFTPAPGEEITSSLKQRFGKYPNELEVLLRCTDGLIFPGGVLYGVQDLQSINVPINAIGEIHSQHIDGVITFEETPGGVDFEFWIRGFDGTKMEHLGSNLAESVKVWLVRNQ